MKLAAPLFALLLGIAPLHAKELKIVTDIAPVGALVSKLTDDPVMVLLQPGQSPHDASLKPSQARALRDADVVIWMGEGLTPSLSRALDQLAGDAVILDLLALENVPYLDFRDEAVFEGHEHDDHGDEEKHEDHDDHDDHDDDDKHDTHEDHDNHDAAEGHDAHDHHGDLDPHAWLSPDIAALWMQPMAQALGAADPQSADEYAAHGVEHAEKLEDLHQAVRTALEPLQGTSFFVAHDAFHYFEEAFGINVVGAISSADGSSASVARLRALQARVETSKALCLMNDASTAEASARKMAQTLDLDVRTLHSLHPAPANADLPLSQQYDAMLNAMAAEFLSCLAD